MIKRLKPMLILAGVAVALGILLWVLVAFVLPSEDAGEEKTNTVVLIDADLTEADRVEIKNTFDEYTLVKEAIGTYYIEGKKGLPMNGDNVEYLLENLTNFSANKMLIEAPTAEQMEGYGLANPAGVVTIVNDDDTYVLSLGTTSASGSYYCQLKGDPAVYLVTATVPDIVLLSRYQFYSRAMIEYEENAQENEDLTDIYIGGSGREQDVRITMQELAEDEVGTTYILTEPFSHSASNSMITGLSDLMLLMADAAIVGDDVSPAGLAEKGLDDPVYIYEYTKGDQTYKVHFGDVNAAGYQYCYETSRPFVYYVKAEEVELLGSSMRDFCESVTYTRSVYEIKGLKVEGNGKTYDITVGEQNEAGDFNVVINNKKVDSELFSDFYSHVITISITDIGEKKAAEPILTVTVTLKDGSQDVMKFYPVSELKCFYELNGSGRFWVGRMNVERILENAQKLYDGDVINLEW